MTTSPTLPTAAVPPAPAGAAPPNVAVRPVTAPRRRVVPEPVLTPDPADPPGPDCRTPDTPCPAASRWNWRAVARCRSSTAEALFVPGAQQREAKDFCRPCPVRTECLAHALDHRVEFGVWGGMTERERRALLRARPGVRCWAEMLADARSAHYAAVASRPEPPPATTRPTVTSAAPVS